MPIKLRGKWSKWALIFVCILTVACRRKNTDSRSVVTDKTPRAQAKEGQPTDVPHIASGIEPQTRDEREQKKRESRPGSAIPKESLKCQYITRCLAQSLPQRYWHEQKARVHKSIEECIGSTGEEIWAAGACLPYEFGRDVRNGKKLAVSVSCSDVCPSYAFFFVTYVDVDGLECLRIGGRELRPPGGFSGNIGCGPANVDSEIRIPTQPSRDDVLKSLRKVQPAVQECAKGQSGIAIADIVVANSGRVKNVRVSRVTGPVAGCIARAVRKAGFPKFSLPEFSVRFPFRLLDWTRSPLIAAYFAAIESVDFVDRKEDGNMVVWAMQTELPYERLGIKIVTPPRASNPNLHAQSGVFTLIRDRDVLSTADELIIRAAKNLDPELYLPLMHKIVIGRNQARGVLRLLAKENITGATLFPGYDGVRRQLRESVLREDLEFDPGMYRLHNAVSGTKKASRRDSSKRSPKKRSPN